MVLIILKVRMRGIGDCRDRLEEVGSGLASQSVIEVLFADDLLDYGVALPEEPDFCGAYPLGILQLDGDWVAFLKPNIGRGLAWLVILDSSACFVLWWKLVQHLRRVANTQLVVGCLVGFDVYPVEAALRSLQESTPNHRKVLSGVRIRYLRSHVFSSCSRSSVS